MPSTGATGGTEPKARTLNGWQRLWVLAALAWGLVVAAGIGRSLYAWPDQRILYRAEVCRGTLDPPVEKASSVYEERRERARRRSIEDAGHLRRFAACYPRTARVASRAVSWLVPVVLAYGLGVGVAWVRRGFRASHG